MFASAIQIGLSFLFLMFYVYTYYLIHVWLLYFYTHTNQHCVLIAEEASNPLHYEVFAPSPYITGEYNKLTVYYTYRENAEPVDKSRPYFTFNLFSALQGSLNHSYAYRPETGPYRGESLTEKEAESQPFSSTEVADNSLVASIDNKQARDYLIKYLTEKKALINTAQSCDINSGLSLLIRF